MKKIKLIFIAAIIACFGNNVNAQCSFTGLEENYCHDSESATLVGTPEGGEFSGDGVTGSMFDPISAGAGDHVVTYNYPIESDKYYIRSTVGEPWGTTANPEAMDLAFGADEWELGFYETVDPAVVFTTETGFVYMDGSDDNTLELEAFLTANLPVIESWVNDGGRLIINAAPNEGTGMDLGFGGTTLVYGGGASSVDVVDLTHPAYLGPNTPLAGVMTGGSYSHAYITGTGYTNVLVNSSDVTSVILCEKPWGAGRVMMGGMTTHNYHSPALEASNFKVNLLDYMGNWTNKFYVRASASEPWSSAGNTEAMDLTFGAGNWGLSFFETLDPATVFSSQTSFIYMDGSDIGASEMTDFLADNIELVEDWVQSGGSLLMNAAPNEGGDIDLGFDGTTLNYSDPSASVNVNDLVHPAYLGPNTPTSSVMTGSDFAHATISGTDYTPLLLNSSDVTKVVLCEKDWGFGHVMMGGMTTSNFHSPLLEAANYRANIMVHLAELYDGFYCISEQTVTVLEPLTISYTATDEVFGSDASISVIVTGGLPEYDYDWDNDGTGDFDDVEDLSGLTGGTYVLVVEDSIGCVSTITVDINSQVGIDTESQIAVKLYPNPATNMTTLEVDGVFTYQILDLNGKMVSKGNGFNQEVLALSGLESGVYFIQVVSDNVNQTIKMVKK